MASDPPANGIPTTLTHPAALRFWLAVVLTGIGTGVSAAVLTLLVAAVQRLAWPGSTNLLTAAAMASAWRHVAVLLGAGLLTGAGQILLRRLTSGNAIDLTEAIWFRAGRLPAWRTLGTAVLSEVLVGMGSSLGREAAPKQAGAVIANALSDRHALSDEQRRLLVACGAGAGMAAAYGVPLGGALYAVEVLRGTLALRLLLPALLASLIATAMAWLVLPDTVTYAIPAYASSWTVVAWALVAGPAIGVVAVGFVKAVAWADAHKPVGWRRIVWPVVALGTLGLVSIPFPQLLGNGHEVAQLALVGQVVPPALLALMLLKPTMTVLCMGGGAPGGLFTPSLSFGALVGAALGYGWSLLWPGAPLGLYALCGAGALLAATTQGPISAMVLMMELTGRDRSFVVPMLLAVVAATLVARSIEPRSIYDARLSDAEVAARQRSREPPSHPV